MNHVSYAGRRYERYRFDGDAREYTLNISKATADAILVALSGKKKPKVKSSLIDRTNAAVELINALRELEDEDND